MQKINWSKGHNEGNYYKTDRLRSSYPAGVFDSCIAICNFCSRNDPGWCCYSSCQVFNNLKDCMEELCDIDSEIDREVKESYKEFINDNNCEI